jgi:FkbM family methyltransferase
MGKLSEALGVPGGFIRIADVGAAFLGQRPPYQALIDEGVARRFAFEPDEARLDELRATLEEGAVLLPYALGDGGTHRLHVAPGGMTSLLEPDPDSYAFLTPFGRPPFSPVPESVRVTEIATRRLDDLDEVPAVDFLKIDVQGAELMILRNGRAKLSDCAVVQIEMPFFALYKNQPGFADLDAELRSLGLVVHGLAELKRYPVAPFEPDDLWRGLNQLVEVDMIYVRDLKAPGSVATDQLTKIALICDACYGSFDIAARCLTELERRSACPAGTAGAYLASLRGRSRSVTPHELPAWP